MSLCSQRRFSVPLKLTHVIYKLYFTKTVAAEESEKNEREETHRKNNIQTKIVNVINTF